MTPTVSVVIPLHNGAKYIETAVRSVLEQKSVHVQMIIVDDGSSDNGIDICRNVAPEGTFLRTKGLGVACARNLGLSVADADWVAFLDQDDVWFPDRLKSALFVKGAADVVVTGETSFGLDQDRELLRAANNYWPSVWIRDEEDVVPWALAGRARVDCVPTRVEFGHMLRRPIALTTSFVCARDFLTTIGGFPVMSRNVDDHLMLVNAARLGHVLHVDQQTVGYRIRPDSTYQKGNRWWPYLTATLASARGGWAFSEEGFETARHLLTDLGRRSDSAPDVLAMGQLLGINKRTLGGAILKGWLNGRRHELGGSPDPPPNNGFSGRYF